MRLSIEQLIEHEVPAFVQPQAKQTAGKDLHDVNPTVFTWRRRIC